MRIPVNGISLNVDVVGEGSPLLLLHGFTGSIQSWTSFLTSWVKNHQVIMVDIIGHGQSDSPTDPHRYSMDHAVKDLSFVLDHLNVEKADVLGYSMGGRLALGFAVNQPARVNRLLLESSSPGLKTDEERLFRRQQDEALARSIEEGGLEAFIERWENLLLFESLKRMPEDINNSIRQQRLQNSTVGLANSLRGMGTGAQPSFWDHLHEVNVPNLLLAGELDRKFCNIAGEMHQKLPSSHLKEIEGAGHIIHVEQRELFDTIVMEFLST